VAAILIQAMSKSTGSSYGLRLLAEGLTAVAARLEPKDAAKAAASLSQALTSTTSRKSLPFLAQVC